MKGCRALTDDEVALVSKSFSGTYAARDKALFVLGVKSSFRISELLSLTVGGCVAARPVCEPCHGSTPAYERENPRPQLHSAS
jgi:hypothetical protein